MNVGPFASMSGNFNYSFILDIYEKLYMKYLDPLPVTKVVDSQSFLFQKFKHSWSLLDIKLHGSLKNSEIPELPEVFCGICLATKETTFSFSSDYINSFTVVKLESTDV